MAVKTVLGLTTTTTLVQELCNGNDTEYANEQDISSMTIKAF